MGTMGHTAGLRRAFLFYLLLRLTLTNSLLGKSRSRTVISASGPTGIWIQQSLRSLCLSAHSSTGDAFASQLQNKSALNLPLQRQRQVRRKHVNRRPKYYWFNATNLRNELFNFWTQRGVQLKKSQIPPIPSEVILLYYERHDLRAAIAKNGGRLSVSNMLRGAPIVPGRWQDAVEESPETRALIEADPILSLERPPSMPGMTVSNLAGVKDSGNFTQVRWLHQSGRKPKGFWNLQTTVEEL